MSDSDVISGGDPSGSDDEVRTSTLEVGGNPGLGTAAPVRFPELRGGDTRERSAAPLERIHDLTVPVAVELGGASLTVQEILELAPGAIVELDRPADSPVELHVHGKCVARGQIVVVDGYYGIRITSLDP
jgi:flagellar motor switch protein FliN/FliY